jgi:uncharacterized membrane protein
VSVGAASAKQPEPTWGAAVAIVAVVLLQLLLPNRLVAGGRWLLPVLEIALLVPLMITGRYRHHEESSWARVISMTIIAVITAANSYALVLLAYYLIRGSNAAGHDLILSAIVIWFTNVVAFGLWYWELDRGGPGARTAPEQPPPELLFPQMANPDQADEMWRPLFVDYLYVSYTNATAFSPTDTMPMSRRIKALMTVQSLVSFVTVGLVAARAVNILS